VTVSGDAIEFCFRAKNRRLVRRSITSAPLARGVRDLLALPNGSRLFRFERDGELLNLTAPLLNGYIGEHLGEGFTAKDFRTWGGSLLAAATVVEHYLAGRTIDDLRSRNGAGPARLTADEKALVRLLRSKHS
jgi:DNA topoisomerase-1